MSKNSRELPKERLASTDESGLRVYLYPMAVKGFFNSARLKVQWFLIVLFLLLPWLKMNGKQALFLDIANRKFNFFGLILWAHDVPILFFLLMGFLLTVAWLTAVYGRVWCGWACPQTVFIERIFRQIEKWVEGDHLTRKRRDAGPMNGDRFVRLVIKWILFIAASGVITHSILAYFVGTDQLAKMMVSSPSENWTAFLFILFSTGIILFDFGWFREQFCIIACPYGRFQSVLMDRHSKNVIYDDKRGEPRGKLSKSLTDLKGDCIDCFKCVQACPTGVDIRRGTQLECIACTACIDACDEVMLRLDKPKGLIRYDTEDRIQQPISERKAELPKLLRPKLYFAGVALMLLGMVITLSMRVPVRSQFIRAHDVPYRVEERNGAKFVINHYSWIIQNQMQDPVEPKIELTSANTVPASAIRIIDPFSGRAVAAGKSDTRPLFIEIAAEQIPLGRLALEVQVAGEKQIIQVLGPFSTAPLPAKVNQ